jgi:hypothetical protein
VHIFPSLASLMTWVVCRCLHIREALSQEQRHCSSFQVSAFTLNYSKHIHVSSVPSSHVPSIPSHHPLTIHPSRSYRSSQASQQTPNPSQPKPTQANPSQPKLKQGTIRTNQYLNKVSPLRTFFQGYFYRRWRSFTVCRLPWLFFHFLNCVTCDICSYP